MTLGDGRPIIRLVRGQPFVTYVLAGSETRTSADAIVACFAAWIPAGTPVCVCRETGPDGGVLPEAPSTPTIHEVWRTDVAWLGGALEAGLDNAAAARLVVSVDWPLSADVELTLLEARLRAPLLRLAVWLAPADVEAAFPYLDRFGFAWLALPRRLDAAWAEALRALGRRWCLDPRARTPVEPVQSAFARAQDAGGAAPAWRYRAVDVAAGAGGPLRLWSPSAHALFLGAGRDALALSLDMLPALDRAWADALPRIAPAPGRLPIATGGSR